MNRLIALKNQIEALRNELNESIVNDCYEVYYKKSVEMDQLIEAYIELETEVCE